MPEGNFYNAPPKPDPSAINVRRGYDDNTYLHDLAERGAPESYIKEAIKMGADINALNRQKMPPLALAIMRGSEETVKALIDAGASLYFEVTPPGAAEKSFFNATYIAAASGTKTKLEIVLQKGGDAFVNSPGIEADGYDSKLKPLHAAVKKWRSDAIGPLVDAGAFVGEEAGWGKETPLMMAVANDSEETILRLVKRGASLEQKHSDSGNTALLYACALGKYWAGEKLVALGADGLAVNKQGNTGLMLAAQQGSVKLVTQILQQKPDINARNNDGMTALMLAAARGNSDVVNALLKAGADPLLTDTFNRTARAHAANVNNYSNSYYGGPSVSWILEEAEKSALQKQFEKTYDEMKKKPGPPAAGPSPSGPKV